MTSNIQIIRQRLNQLKSKVGLVNSILNLTEYDEMEHNVSASISPRDWTINIKVRKGYDPISDKKQKAYAKKKFIKDGLETLLTHVGVVHEPAHWELPVGSGKGCPYNTYNHDKILEAIKNALPTDKQSESAYVANAFEDLLINSRCKEWNKDFSGQVLFFDWEGLSCKEKGLAGYTPFYEAFVKLNMYLWGDNADRKLVRRHYSNSKNISKAIRGVIDELHLQKNIESTDMLFDRQKWPEMARIFAQNLVELLETPPTERLSAFSSENSEGQGQAGNGIEQKAGTRDGKEEIAYGRYISGDEQSANITSYEQLDLLYRKLARTIPVDVEAMTKEHSLQIAPLTFRPFDEETDDITKVKSSKLKLTGNGLTFAYPAQPLTIAHRSKIQRKSFPDFKLVVLDNSGSMAEGVNGYEGSTSFIPWGDQSKYHYALLGFYGIENFLQMQGVAQYINHGLSLFSSSMRYKEGTFTDVEKVRKLALAPEFGGTKIDASDLVKALNGRESFVLSISDGDIENWDSQKSDFRKLAKNNYFAHVQIGSKNEFTADLESWQLPVFYVNSGEDLSKLMVSAAKETYRRFVRQ